MASPTQLSNIHTTLILNGTRITGFSDDSPPVELPDIELAEETYGQDGTMYTMGTARKGGEVTIKLLPSSPSTKFLMRKHAEIQNGARIVFNGTYGDSTLGYSTTLRGGVLKTAPAGISPGKNAEFVIAFEELIPNFDAAQFAPTPASA